MPSRRPCCAHGARSTGSRGAPLILSNNVNRRTPYVFQYLLNVQRQINRGTLVEVGYTGNQGHKLERFRNYNMPLPGPGNVQQRRPFPELGVIQMTDGVVSSNYHALATKVQMRLGNDLTTLASVCDKSMLMSDELMLINYVKTLLLSPRISFAGFVAKDGTGWLYSRQKMFQLSDIRDYSIKSILESNGLLKHEVKTDSGERVIALSQPVRDRGYVRLGYSKDVLEQLFQERIGLKFKRCVGVCFIAILLGLLLARFLSNHLSKPLHALPFPPLPSSPGCAGRSANCAGYTPPPRGRRPPAPPGPARPARSPRGGGG